MYKDAGKILRDRREKKNLSLEKVSADLFIRITYLNAIENGRAEILPSPAQGRGFVRMYARYLKLNADDILQIWDSPDMGAFAMETTPGASSALSTGSSTGTPTTEAKSSRFTKVRNWFPFKKDNRPSQESADNSIATASDSPAQSIFNEIGATLRERRELLGLSYADAEKFTNVRADQLVLLEEGRFSELQSSVQARGILYNYANFLSLNVEEIILNFANALQLLVAARNYRAARTENKPKPVKKAHKLAVFFTPDLFVGVTVIIGLIALAIYSAVTIPVYRNKENLRATQQQEFIYAAQTGTPVPTETKPAPVTAPTATTAFAGALINEAWEDIEPFDDTGMTSDGNEGETGDPNAPVVDENLLEPTPTETQVALDGTIRIYIEANQRTYLKVSVDGNVIYNGRTEPGKTYPFSANQIIELETGNASAIRVQYNNRNLGIMGNVGEVKKIQFTEGLVLTSTPVISPTPTETFEPTYTLQADVATPTITITPYIP